MVSTQYTEIVQLEGLEPFSKGGNRLCFVSPLDPNQCLKVFQERGTPQARRQRAGFFGKFRLLSSFDENLHENKALTSAHACCSEAVRSHLPKSFGFIKTDLGVAHVVELIRDDDGKISRTLEQYLWQYGLDSKVSVALDKFEADWRNNPPPTRDLLPHNIVLKSVDSNLIFFLIDGFTRSHSKHSILKKRGGEKKLAYLRERIQLVLDRKLSEASPKPRILQLNRNL